MQNPAIFPGGFILWQPGNHSRSAELSTCPRPHKARALWSHSAPSVRLPLFLATKKCWRLLKQRTTVQACTNFEQERNRCRAFADHPMPRADGLSDGMGLCAKVGV